MNTGLSEPAFRLGERPISGDVVLAPMSGFTDLPFRLICRRCGSAMSYTEFVSAKAVLYGASAHARRVLRFASEERPVVVQLFDGDEDRLVAAAEQVAELGPDAIDVNMGCSIHRIASRGAGAGLLRAPAKVGRIFSRLARHVSVPVTGKIRLGWDAASRNYLDIVRAMQDNGAAAVAVHARTRDQGYRGASDWDAIARVVAIAVVPVIGNGDVRTAADIDRMKAQTGCAAVMIGRAAIGHPWIFSRQERPQVSLSQRLGMIREHFAHMRDFYGDALAPILMRKHLSRYLTDYAGARAWRNRLVRVETAAELERVLAALEEQAVV